MATDDRLKSFLNFLFRDNDRGKDVDTNEADSQSNLAEEGDAETFVDYAPPTRVPVPPPAK